MRLPFRRLALPLVGLALATVPAAAEDFSGFYAGVNAGYAFDRSSRDGTAPYPFIRDRDDGLPPSAASSDLATRRDRTGDPNRRPR